MLSADEEAKLRERLDQLILEHRDLDDVITTLAGGVYPDQLQIRRLKKRKLALRDIIERIRSTLIPDLGA